MIQISAMEKIAGLDALSTEVRWYAAYTASHHEKHVAEQLTRRNIECFLPLYKEVRCWCKRKPVELAVPLFSNYVFVHVHHGQRSTVLGTPGIVSIVGSSQRSWDLPDHEIEALRNGTQGRDVRPHPYLTVGERARVKSGLLTGLEGVILREKRNLRLVLSLDRIMQSVAIEVNAEEMEPLPANASTFPTACSIKSLHAMA